MVGSVFEVTERGVMQFVKESFIRATCETVFAFHEQSDALRQLMPPWESSRVIKAARISEVGSQAVIETKILGPFRARWIAEHTACDPPYMFEDIQRQGPFRKWRHRHIVERHADGTTLRDEIDYEPPLWFIGRIAAPFLIEPRLRKLFDYRHEVTRRWCEERNES